MFEKLLELSTLFFDRWLLGHLDWKWTMSCLDSKTFVVFQVFHNLINGTHSSIAKHANPFSEYYYYHKTWGYSLDCQVVVHDKKQLLTYLWSFLGMWMIQKFSKDQVFPSKHNTVDYSIWRKDAKMIYLLICLEIRNIPC